MNHERSFNLVDDPWIRAISLSGEMREYSLLELFRKADTLAFLANDLPTQDFAILRLLLAVLQRSIAQRLDGSEDPAEVWEALWKAESLPLPEVESYFSKWRNRFDLFDPEKPFMQVAGMHTAKNGVSPIGKIIADVPDGAPFFTMRSKVGAAALTSAEAARWLVHVHAFDTAGIKSGVVGDDSVKGGKSYSTGYPGWAGCLGGLYFEDSSLARTLLVNLVLWDSRSNQDEIFPFDDVPVWEQAPTRPGSSGRGPKGFSDTYTWQSRRVLLHASEDGVNGVVLTNGDKLDPYNRQGLENMSVWRRSPNQEKKLGISPVYYPVKHSVRRSLWRSLSSVLPQADLNGSDMLSPGIVDWVEHLQEMRRFPKNRPLRLHATGLAYDPKNSVITEMVDDALTLNSFLLGPDGRDGIALVRDVLKRTDDAVFALGSFARNLSSASGDDDRSGSARDHCQAEAYYELGAAFRPWLACLSSDISLREAEQEWNGQARRIVRRMADDLVRQVDSRAISGHKTKSGWMTAAKAESIFHHQINKLLPLAVKEKEGK